jgi:hypothetical protein
MAARLSFIEEAPEDLRVFSFTADAMIFAASASSFTADAYINDPSHNLTMDAVIAATVTQTFSANAVLVERMPGATVLDGDIDATQTTITVTSAAGFPQSGTYVINIGSEQLEVTGGQGTLVWTVTRGFNGTTAALHSDGTNVTEEC